MNYVSMKMDTEHCSASVLFGNYPSHIGPISMKHRTWTHLYFILMADLHKLFKSQHFHYLHKINIGMKCMNRNWVEFSSGGWRLRLTAYIIDPGV